jgi:hypothetical protein
MAWLLFILFLFFAWRAAAYFRQGRPQAAILALGACALFLAGIFANYIMFQRRVAESAAAAPAEPAAPAATPTEPAPMPSAVVDEPPTLDSFYEEADDPVVAEEEIIEE